MATSTIQLIAFLPDGKTYENLSATAAQYEQLKALLNPIMKPVDPAPIDPKPVDPTPKPLVWGITDPLINGTTLTFQDENGDGTTEFMANGVSSWTNKPVTIKSSYPADFKSIQIYARNKAGKQLGPYAFDLAAAVNKKTTDSIGGDKVTSVEPKLQLDFVAMESTGTTII